MSAPSHTDALHRLSFIAGKLGEHHETKAWGEEVAQAVAALSTTQASAPSARAVAEKCAEICKEHSEMCQIESVQLADVGAHKDSNYEEARSIAAKECEIAILAYATTLPVAVSETPRGDTAKTCRHGWRGTAIDVQIQTPCPACGAKSLFIGEGGHLTCARVPNDHSDGCHSPSVEETVNKLKADLAAHGGSAKVPPLDPTKEMIEAGAQRLVRWETGDEKWPGSWDALQVHAARNEAERVWRSMWLEAMGEGR